MAEKVRAHIFILGRVQGIGFRFSVARDANKLNLTGWVRNLPNSRVEAVFEGEKEKIKTMIEWIRQGPILAKVDNINVIWEQYQGEFKNFEITY